MKELDKYVKEVNRNIGYRIYQARLECGISREDLAKHIAVSKERIDRYDRMSDDKLKLISEKLKKPIDYFYHDALNMETILPPIIDRDGKNKGYIRLVKKLAKLTNLNQQRALLTLVDGLL